MTPEEVFKGLNSQVWSLMLCRCMLQHEERIGRKLGDDERRAAFTAAMREWNADHVNGRDNAWDAACVEGAAMSLFGICRDHGVIQFLLDEGLLRTGPIRTRGGTRGTETVRTRGARPVPFAEIRERMQQVAALYGRERHGRGGAR
jgi:hypothetical protein